MTRFTKGTYVSRSVERNLAVVGEQLRLARLRRDLTIEQVASRIQVSRNTVAAAEKGKPSVSIGVYAKILFVYQMEDQLLQIAADDVLGHNIQDLNLKQRKRASSTK